MDHIKNIGCLVRATSEASVSADLWLSLKNQQSFSRIAFYSFNYIMSSHPLLQLYNGFRTIELQPPTAYLDQPMFNNPHSTVMAGNKHRLALLHFKICDTSLPSTMIVSQAVDDVTDVTVSEIS